MLRPRTRHYTKFGFVSAILVLTFFWIGLSGAAYTQSKLPFEQHVLPVDRAFQLREIFIDADQVIHISWQVAPGYYLYQEKFSLSTPPHVQLGALVVHADHRKYDPAFDKATGLLGAVTLVVPINRSISGDFDLSISYQGCSERGFCYPPTQRTVALHAESVNAQPKHKHLFSPDLLESKLPWLLLSFFGFGLALSCTPCILPMVPIVFGLLTRMGESRRPWVVVGIYVVTMACTYALAGLLSARLGMSLQGLFQKPAALVPMSLLLVLLGLNQWQLFTLPNLNTNTWLHSWAQRLPNDSLIGVVLMGIIATLITSPCVTPPLIGALTYIADTQHLFIGGMALWVMGMGMGTPLLVFALFGPRFFPRAGYWMEQISLLTGSLLIALAISLLERIWFGPYTSVLWIALFLGLALRLLRQAEPSLLTRLYVTLCAVYAFGLGYYAALGSYSVLSPCHAWSHAQMKETLIFRSARTLSELQAQLREAQQQSKPVLLEFTADWCKTCQVIKQRLWVSCDIEAALANWTLIRVDITQQTGLQMAMMLQYGIFGPPQILFFDSQGVLHPDLTLVNTVTPEEFKQRLRDCQPESSPSLTTEG